jgi:hypothetical protein
MFTAVLAAATHFSRGRLLGVHVIFIICPFVVMGELKQPYLFGDGFKSQQALCHPGFSGYSCCKGVDEQ